MTSPGRGALAAWRFLTRIPLGGAADGDTAMAQAPAWFGLIGALIGAFVGAVYVALFELVGAGTAAATAIAAGTLITGAFHHDGLADMADGFGGGWTVEQRLAILHDSRHGTYGVVSLVCALVIQISALSQTSRAQGLVALIAAHALSRAGAVGLMRWAPRAAPSGLGIDYARRVTNTTVCGALGSAGVIAALANGVYGLAFIATTAAACVAVGALAWRKIGGVTGDVLGAAEQIGETLALVAAAALARHATAWPWWK